MLCLDLKNFIDEFYDEKLDFSYREVKIFDNKERILNIPNDRLKEIQNKLNAILQKHYIEVKPNGIFGYIKSTNNERFTHKDAAEYLLNSKYIYKFDIKNFFKSVKPQILKSLFTSNLFNLEYSYSDKLIKIVSYNNYLPMGAPSSPMIINYLFIDIDNHIQKKLSEISNQHNYCRYCDDIFVGSNIKNYNEFNRISELISNTLKNYGLVLNDKKTKILKPDYAQFILGLKINSKVNIDRKYIRNINATLHNLKFDLKNEYKIYQRKYKTQFVEISLKSKIEYIGFIKGKDNSFYIKLINKYNLIFNDFKHLNKSAAYSYLKSTQGDDTNPKERRDRRSGIFEGFLDYIGNTEELNNFLEQNGLQVVLMKSNTDPSLFDGKYFDTLEELESKGVKVSDEDIMLAFVYKGTDKVANIKRIDRLTDSENPLSRVTTYEVIPIKDINEEENSRGNVEQDGDVTTTVVSLIQAVPKKDDAATKNSMINTRVFLKLSSNREEAKKHIEKSFGELVALRKKITKTNKPVAINPVEITVGANHILDFYDKTASISLNEILEFKYADIEVPLSPDALQGFLATKGKPYVALKNINNITEFYLPVIVPNLEEVTLGNKPVLDNIADILFSLQSSSIEEYESKLQQINNALSRSSNNSNLLTMFGDILYKPKKELSSNRIYLSPNEFVELSFNFSPNKGNKQYFVAKRIKLDPKEEGKVIFSYKVRIDYDKQGNQNYTQEQLRKEINSIFKGVKINIREPYLRKDKDKFFGYINLTPNTSSTKITEDNQLGFSARTINKKEEGENQPIDYRKLLSQIKVRVKGGFQPSFDTSNKEQPFNRIGKGIIFEKGSQVTFEITNLKESKDDSIHNQETEEECKGFTLEEWDKMTESLEDLKLDLNSSSIFNTETLKTQSQISKEEAIKKALENRKKRLAEPKKPREGLNDIEFLSSKEIQRIESSQISEEDIQRVKSLFVQDINIEQLYDVVNSNAWATWTASAIRLFKGSNRSDLYHEAWHHFSQLYLTRENKKDLYNEVREKKLSFKNASDIEVEEFVAKEFSKYALANGNYDLGKFRELDKSFSLLILPKKCPNHH